MPNNLIRALFVVTLLAGADASAAEPISITPSQTDCSQWPMHGWTPLETPKRQLIGRWASQGKVEITWGDTLVCTDFAASPPRTFTLRQEWYRWRHP